MSEKKIIMKIEKQIKCHYKRCFILFVVVLMYQAGIGMKVVSMNSITQIPYETKELKIGKDGKYIRRNYPKTYSAMREFALRSAPLCLNEQQVEFDRQSMAFSAIEKAWTEAEDDSSMRKAIKIGLLRWNWLQGDPILNNPRPVDWYMVYMECIYK